ncbi:terpene synthase 02 [Raphanus sativus]|nr:terpene synthase 02 [Raphanus sativus]
MQNGLISSSVPTILLHLLSVLSDHTSDQTLTDVPKITTLSSGALPPYSVSPMTSPPQRKRWQEEIHQSQFNVTSNLNRVVQCIYQHGDGHGFPEKAKTVDHINSLFFNPVPF